jgi:predicted O-methyltransferase YrrM
MPKAVREYFQRASAEFNELQTRVRGLERALDVLIASPAYKSADNWAFNGQTVRKQLFQKLICAIDFKAIIETGTFVGETTAYMAETSGLPVYTCESHERFHAMAKRRVAGQPIADRISFDLAPSTVFLERLGRTELASVSTFLYLDAHWYCQLPAREEIELIARKWDQFVIMIDDFEVAGDSGYGYDDYGCGKALTLNALGEAIESLGLICYFPSIPSSSENGSKRGCVVLIRQGTFQKQLDSLDCLKRFRGQFGHPGNGRCKARATS